jgi:hypothetical protein
VTFRFDALFIRIAIRYTVPSAEQVIQELDRRFTMAWLGPAEFLPSGDRAQDNQETATDDKSG